MPREAEAEALAMDYSAGALNVAANSSLPLDGRPEALATQEGPHVHAVTTVATSPPATVAAAGVTTSKNNLPVLDFLHWSDSYTFNPSRARISATNDSSAFMNASDESPLIQAFICSEARSSATNDSSAFMNASDESPLIQVSEVRTGQPAGGTSTISFGANLTLEESKQLQKRCAGSDSKRREMIGSRILDQDLTSEPAPADQLAKKTLPAGLVTSIRSGIKSNAIPEDSALSPKRASSLSEMAKQRELSGTFFGAGRDTPTSRRPNSSAKFKELEGSNIFGQSSHQDQFNTTPKSRANDPNKLCQEKNAPPRTGVKVSNPAGGRSQIIFGGDGGQQYGAQCKTQAPDQKATELFGHDTLKAKASAGMNNNRNSNNERLVSAAKRREMIGNDIFTDSSAMNEDHSRRARQPPGGESNLKLC